MSYTIKLLPMAHDDLRKAKKWHQGKNETLAKEFKIEVNKEIDYIRGIPRTLPTKI